MKSLWIASCLLVSCSITTLAQTKKELPPGYYVVVGAYAANRENIAQNFQEVLRLKGLDARYGFNSTKNLYFVYIDVENDLKSALGAMYKHRRSAGFSDAWVRVVSGQVAAETVTTPTTTSVPSIQSTEKTPGNVIEKKNEKTSEDTPPQIEVARDEKKDVVATIQDNPSPVINRADTILVTDNPEIVQYDSITLGNTEVFLSLFNARNNKIVEGRVKVIDTDRNKLLKEVDGNDYLYLPDPKTTSGKLTLICESFGYRKVQQEINYPLPLADTVKEYVELLGTTFIIYFDLARYRIGDRVTLYNVYFFNDAAVMLPESKYELTSLLEMMKENAGYKVRLHGHTNGNYHGRILKVGESKNFFSLDGSVNAVGTAKDLSYERAEVIKDYLVANGINADRIEVKAWGGKKPLFDRHGANAKKNVRVEVEILND
jgi:outer membrane protein OmpA-like peptidoglycan-associated protein